MNFSKNPHRGSPTHKENIPSSTKAESFQYPRTTQRTVLGSLSENEQRGRSLSQRTSMFQTTDLLHREASFPSTVLFQTARSSTFSAAHPAPAMMCTLRRLVKLSSPLRVRKSFQMVMTLRLMPIPYSCQDASMLSEPDESLISGETFCFDYAEDIYKNLRESEKQFRPKPSYLERHPEITNGMRVILVDWLVEVVQEYKLGSETLHLAVNYLDRFLSYTTFIKRNKLQLVGTAALLIAAKYEEIFPPELNEFVYITDCTYAKKQLLRMESVLLKVLDFKMAAPTTNQFLRLFMFIHSVCSTTENLAMYIAELSLLETDPFLQYTPSILAAGTYCLATYTIHKSYWPDSLITFTGYTMEEIMPCLTSLHKLYISAETRPQQAVRDKYKTSKYGEAESPNWNL
uniref:G2/mitotic-specific cyclin-B2 n=1 Tax=Xiphophorus maculatus TaxID=8083 RepID=M4A286_XIPMA